MGLLEGHHDAPEEEAVDERSLPGALPGVRGEEPPSVPRGNLNRAGRAGPEEPTDEAGERDVGELGPPAARAAGSASGRPERGGGAKSGMAPGRTKKVAKTVAASRSLRGAGGWRQELEAGGAQGLEQGELVHYLDGAAPRAAKEVQKSFHTHGGPGVAAMCGRSSGSTETRSTIWS